jgi:hypothetical protein
MPTGSKYQNTFFYKFMSMVLMAFMASTLSTMAQSTPSFLTAEPTTASGYSQTSTSSNLNLNCNQVDNLGQDHAVRTYYQDFPQLPCIFTLNNINSNYIIHKYTQNTIYNPSSKNLQPPIIPDNATTPKLAPSQKLTNKL